MGFKNSPFLAAYIFLVVFLFGSTYILANPAINQRLSKAEEIISYMNTSVDPCEDFYEFTCGNYATHHTAVEKQVALLDLSNEMQLQLVENLLQILSTDDDTDTEIDVKVKGIFRTCLELPERMKTNPNIYRELSAEIGQMPALVGAEWQEDEFDWMKTIAEIKHDYDLDILSELLIIPDYTNNSVNGLYIAEPHLRYTSRAMYLDEENASDRQRYAFEIRDNLQKYLGIEEALAQKTAFEIVQFEVALAKGLPDDKIAFNMSELYVPVSLQALQEKYVGHWNVSEQLQLTLGSIPPYQPFLNNDYQDQLLNALQQTPKSTVANYIHYNFLKNFVVQFPKEDSKNIQISCLATMRAQLSRYFDNLLYRKYKLNEAEQGVLDMWQHIKLAFKETLLSDRLNWQQQETRKFAMEKLDAMELIIKSYKDYDMKNDVGDFVLDSHNFLNNFKGILAANGIKSRNRINEPPQGIDVSSRVTQSAMYMSLENKIFIPVYILQPLYMWSNEFPNAYNFAVLGSIVAHEVLHGFDNNGRHYDSHGNIYNWWDKESLEEFEKRVECFTNQYKQYVFAGHKLKETKVQKENIADNGGVRLAYKAYLNWYSSQEESLAAEETFPGLNFNHNQLFFISHSHLWCSDIDSKYIALRVNDPHAPEKFRIIGAFSNFEEFSKEFHCPVGSGMNPQSKCEIY